YAFSCFWPRSPRGVRHGRACCSFFKGVSPFPTGNRVVGRYPHWACPAIVRPGSEPLRGCGLRSRKPRSREHAGTAFRNRESLDAVSPFFGPITKRNNIMSIGTILLIVLVLILVGALPTWPYSSGWGYYPSGALG